MQPSSFSPDRPVANPQQIAQLVDNLAHPDQQTRRKYMNRLIELGSEAVPVLTANLRMVEANVRPSLVRVIGEIGDDEALLPLMRYVFDTEGEPAEGDARGLAMQAIMQIAEPRHADRLFEFLLDMKEDEDPFVRGYVIEAFGRLGDKRAMPFVREAFEDPDEFVRECADRARAALENSDTASLDSKLSGRELLQKIRTVSGSELDYYMSELLERDDAFELAVKLVREDDHDTLRGLRTLQKLGDPRARDVVRRQFDVTTSEAARAVCLRILAGHLEGDATADEVAVIEKGLHSRDGFISLAALRAAGASGHYDLTMAAIKAVKETDTTRAVTAAEALAHGFSPDLVRLLPEVLEALERTHRRRLSDPARDLVRTEAFLLRALDRVVDADTMGASDVRQAALESLEDAAEQPPILVTSLSLLIDLLPEDGLPQDRQWSGPAVQPLLDLLNHSDARVSERALTVLERAVAPDAPGLSDELSRLLYSDTDQLLDHVIPLLERIGDRRARELLEELSNHNDETVVRAADAALRRGRDSGSTLDVKYE